MARLALITLVALPLIASCGTFQGDDRFSEPNSLMGQEIDSRISQIEFQHREELFNNLLWLAQSGEQAIPGLLIGLRNSMPKVRSNCAWVLGQIGDRRVIEDLRPLVNDGNETVRLEASRSLVLLGDVAQCPPLIDALDDDRAQVRYLCHEALKKATGQDFGYDHLSENVQERRQTTLVWREWWSQMSGDPWFAKTYANKHGLGDRPAEPAPGEVDLTPATPMFENNESSNSTGMNSGMNNSTAFPGTGTTPEAMPETMPPSTQPTAPKTTSTTGQGFEWGSEPAENTPPKGDDSGN